MVVVRSRKLYPLMSLIFISLVVLSRYTANLTNLVPVMPLLQLHKETETCQTNTSPTRQPLTLKTLNEMGIPENELSPSVQILLSGALQKRSVIDQAINHTKEDKRCTRYGFRYDQNRTERRRIFWGSLIADDSWHVLGIAAMEYYDMLHTAAFVESNQSQMLYNREMRFGPHDDRLELIQSGMFGPKTKVSVDYYYRSLRNETGLIRENLQRALIVDRWQKNGMREDDIGYISDVDEVITRDFLRALQLCSDIPQFQPDEDCVEPKILGSTLVYEGSPMCIARGRKWYHPDLAIGHCIAKIGNETNPSTNASLWTASDFRNRAGGRQIEGRLSKNGMNVKIHTGYHFHNFFQSVDSVRFKYKTYGHPVHGAFNKPLGDIHEDLDFMTDCIMNRTEDGNRYRRQHTASISCEEEILGVPIAFQEVGVNYSTARHYEMKTLIEKDEKSLATNETNE